jgi:arylsulfatase A-like enzyme
MHFRTHPKPSSVGQAGRWQDVYHDVMIDHDKNVGTVVDKIDQLGLTNDTIIFYSTDNGPHMNAWPDAAMTPFRNEKSTNWEGAFRVPAMVRWPGKIKPGSISNEIMSHLDWAPTLLAAAGMPDIKEKLLAGNKIGDMTYKVHLDGYNFLPYLTGQEATSPRVDYFYFSDDGDLMCVRYDNWKIVFAVQPVNGTFEVWQKEFEHPRVPYIYNLRTDPFERATITSNTYYDWALDHSFLAIPAQGVVGQFLATFKDYPPRQKAASFTIQQILDKMSQPRGG